MQTSKLGDTGGGKTITEEVAAEKDKRIKELEEEVAKLKEKVNQITSSK